MEHRILNFQLVLKDSDQLLRCTEAILACHATQQVFYDIFVLMKNRIQYTRN